jgi:1-acyl-sn-glycerol-3-phosphate acyltransferase
VSLLQRLRDGLPIRAWRPGDPDRLAPPDPDRLERLLALFAPADRVHRYEVRGLEHVPPVGAALLVSHHSYAALDMFLLAARIHRRDGRIPRGLTDHLIHRVPGVRDLFASAGVLRGTPENGLRLLESGQLAVCMPGGGLEWSRSWRQRRQLRWAEHRGYARLAVRAGVPVIPTACPAADDLYCVVNDGWALGETLQRVLGFDRVYPFALPLGLGLLPFPVKLVQWVGEPVHPPAEGSFEERVAAVDAEVRAAIEDFLTR